MTTYTITKAAEILNVKPSAIYRTRARDSKRPADERHYTDAHFVESSPTYSYTVSSAHGESVTVTFPDSIWLASDSGQRSGIILSAIREALPPDFGVIVRIEDAGLTPGRVLVTEAGLARLRERSRK